MASPSDERRSTACSKSHGLMSATPARDSVVSERSRSSKCHGSAQVATTLQVVEGKLPRAEIAPPPPFHLTATTDCEYTSIRDDHETGRVAAARVTD